MNEVRANRRFYKYDPGLCSHRLRRAAIVTLRVNVLSHPRRKLTILAPVGAPGGHVVRVVCEDDAVHPPFGS